MRKFLILGSFCLVNATFATDLRGQPEGGLIQWRKVGQNTALFRAAMAEAKQRETPIMAFFTCGCEECQSLWGAHFSDPAAVKLSARLICLLIKGNVELAREYDVPDCPHIVFIGADGKVMRVYDQARLQKMTGPDFAKRLQRVLAKAK